MQAWRVTVRPPLGYAGLDEVLRRCPLPGEVLVRVGDHAQLQRPRRGVRALHDRASTLPYTPGWRCSACGGRRRGRRGVARPACGRLHGRVRRVRPAGGHPDHDDIRDAAGAELPDTQAAAARACRSTRVAGRHERASVRAGKTVPPRAAGGSARPPAARGRGGRPGHATAGSPDEGGPVPGWGRRGGGLPETSTSSTACSRPRTDARRGHRGVGDSIGGDVTTKTFRCMAFNGATCWSDSPPASRPRTRGSCRGRSCSATSPSPGCVLAYVDVLGRQELTGSNFPSHADGARVHARILEHIVGRQPATRSWVVPLPSTRFRALCKPWRTVRPSGATSSSSGRRPAERPA